MHTFHGNQKGATLAMIVATTVIIILVGIGVYLLIRMFGAGVEVSNSTDSGTLNIAKQGVKIGVDLKNASAVAQENFSAFKDPTNGQIDLITYNRCVAQTVIVALNALAEGTTTAQNNAITLREALKDGGDGIPANQALGNMLYQALSNAANSNGAFGVAGLNSVRMTGANQQTQQDNTLFDVAYVDQNQPSNVYFDQSVFAPLGITMPAGLLSNVTDPTTKLPYLQGYNNPAPQIGDMFQIRGVGFPLLHGQ
jgi:hypothetical protein